MIKSTHPDPTACHIIHRGGPSPEAHRIRRQRAEIPTKKPTRGQCSGHRPQPQPQPRRFPPARLSPRHPAPLPKTPRPRGAAMSAAASDPDVPASGELPLLPVLPPRSITGRIPHARRFQCWERNVHFLFQLFCAVARNGSISYRLVLHSRVSLGGRRRGSAGVGGQISSILGKGIVCVRAHMGLPFGESSLICLSSLMPALFSGGLGLVTILCLGDRHLSASILSPIAVAGCLWGEGQGFCLST
jgi:hypothetical protein